jgi:hypothetical protein
VVAVRHRRALGGQSVEQTHPGLALMMRRGPRRLLLPLLGASALVLLSPERAHAAVRPAPDAAAVPRGTAMPADTADTPAARLLAAVRSLPLARALPMAKPHQDEGTAVHPTLSDHGTRTAVLSSTRPGASGGDLGLIVAGLVLVVSTRFGRAPPACSSSRTRSYERLASPG